MIGRLEFAMEAVINGCPAFAISQEYYEHPDFTLASRIAYVAAVNVLENGLAAGELININVPAIPADECAGVEVTRMGKRIYQDELIERLDPRGVPYYWIGGPPPSGVAQPGTDFHAVVNRRIAITPIQLDLTARRLLGRLNSWSWELPTDAAADVPVVGEDRPPGQRPGMRYRYRWVRVTPVTSTFSPAERPRVPVSMRIPGTAIPGMIIGGLFGSVQREVQELRDALTEELVDAHSTPLTDDGLALDVFSWLRRVPDLKAKIIAPASPLPEATDAMLYVKFGGVGIDVQGRDAVITTTATASLRSLGNNRQLYHTIVRYQDRDSLRNWTEDDNRLWHAYVNYARHYLGRELAARVWNRIDLPHTLAPAETGSIKRDRKNPLHSVSRSRQPELAWTLEIGDLAGGPWADKAGRLNESTTWYDVEPGAMAQRTCDGSRPADGGR